MVSKWANHTSNHKFNQIAAQQILCEMIGITSNDSKMYYQWGRNMDDLKKISYKTGKINKVTYP